MKRLAGIFAVALLAAPRMASACAVCMGDPNSSTGRAANAAIFLMLGVLGSVFALLGAFAYMLYRRSKQPAPPHAELGEVFDASSGASLR